MAVRLCWLLSSSDQQSRVTKYHAITMGRLPVREKQQARRNTKMQSGVNLKNFASEQARKELADAWEDGAQSSSHLSARKSQAGYFQQRAGVLSCQALWPGREQRAACKERYCRLHRTASVTVFQLRHWYLNINVCDHSELSVVVHQLPSRLIAGLNTSSPKKKRKSYQLFHTRVANKQDK